MRSLFTRGTAFRFRGCSVYFRVIETWRSSIADFLLFGVEYARHYIASKHTKNREDSTRTEALVPSIAQGYAIHEKY